MIRFTAPEPVAFRDEVNDWGVVFGGLTAQDLLVLSMLPIDLPKRKGVAAEGEDPDKEYYCLRGASHDQLVGWFGRHDAFMASKVVRLENVLGGDDKPLDWAAMDGERREEFIRFLAGVDGYAEFKAGYLLGPKKKSGAVDSGAGLVDA
jgi:hypothetical protein